MKLLELGPHPDKTSKPMGIAPVFDSKNITKANETSDKPVKQVADKKKHLLWFAHEAPENLSIKEIIARLCLAYVMPWVSFIDWNYKTHTVVLVVIAGYYLMASAITGFDPLKAAWQKKAIKPSPQLGKGL